MRVPRFHTTGVSRPPESSGDDDVRRRAEHARAQGFFDSDADEAAFEDELRSLLQRRLAAFGPAQRVAPPLSAADPLRDLSVREAAGDGDLCVLSAAHADALSFINRRRAAEADAVALSLGRRALRDGMHRVMDACDRAAEGGFDPARNPGLARAAQDAWEWGLPPAAVRTAIDYARQGYEDAPLPFPPDTESPPVPQALWAGEEFIENALTGHGFLQQRDGEDTGHARAEVLWDALAESLWAAGAPRVVFDAAEETYPGARPSRGGGLIFTPGAAAPLAVLNLSGFGPARFDEAVAHAAMILTLALDADAAEPGRSLVLSVGGVAEFLMRRGLAYDSDEGRRAVAAAVATVTGAALETSAAMAAVTGPFEAWPEVEKQILKALRAGGHPALDRAAQAGRRHGFRHAHVTGLVPDASTQQALGLRGRGIAPVSDLVVETPDSAYPRTADPAAVAGLKAIGLTPGQIDDVLSHLLGHGTLLDAPGVDHAGLIERGFPARRLAALEAALKSARDIRRAVMDLDEDAFARLGFAQEAVEAANRYCCGFGTLAGAPHLTPEQARVFDPAPGPLAEMRMQAALEPVMSGGVGHAVVVPAETTVEGVRRLLLKAWELKLKQLWLVRVGGSLSGPGL